MLSFFPLDILNEIWDKIELVSEGFPTYFYISYLIGFARVSSHVTPFNARNKILTAKLKKEVYLYHELRMVSFQHSIVDNMNWLLNSMSN